MDSRVTVKKGKMPILLISPHGPDDKNTDYLTEIMAEKLNCYAVINWGWEKNKFVDCFTDKADCNNLHHCHEDVVFEEFLEPILKFKSQILCSYPKMYQFIIHGISNDIRKKTKDFTTDLVVGWGAGKPPSHTCPDWVLNTFVYLAESMGMTTYAAKAENAFAGKSPTNLNQIWNKWYEDTNCYSLQVQVIYEARIDKETTDIYAEFLHKAILETSITPSLLYEKVPPDYRVKYF